MFDLDLIKSRLSIIDVAHRLNIEIAHSGDSRCPRHGGKSLRIKDDYWRCYGGCNAGGDIFDLYQFIHGGTFRDAVTALADWSNVTEEITPDERRKAEEKRKIEDLLSFAATFYQLQYEGSSAQSYAKKRNIDVDEAHLGYAPDSWTSLVQALTEHNADLDQAVAAGLIGHGARGYYDRLRHRLIIPAYVAGRCIYLQGRSLGTGKTVNEEDAKRKYKNIALADPPLYHLNGAMKNPAPIISESTTDTLRLHQAGLPAIGTYGAALKPHQQKQLERFEQLFIAVQHDKTGYTFADAMARAFGERVRIVPPPQPHADWDEALSAGCTWQADERLSWLRWRLQLIPPTTDFTTLTGKQQLQALLDYLSSINEPAIITTYMAELKTYFGWNRDTTRAYERQVRDIKARRDRESQAMRSVSADDHGNSINIKPDVTFINPAQAYHNGVVYVSRAVTRSITKKTKSGEETYDVHEPVIITSDRRIIAIPELPRGAPAGTLIYLDSAQTIALRGRPSQASTSWSYASFKQHIEGLAPDIQPHDIYLNVLASLQTYVYFPDHGDYVIAALWTLGTYFHQLFDAFPYLAIHGHKGSGKTTLLHWLQHVAFNAAHLVNTSEASLFRWIEATAPTMLIDEQEGLNSRQAARENKADYMGILKAGYQKGATVARQSMENKELTQHFTVYCPKAIAAIEHFEDILENRSLLVYMQPPRKADLQRLNLSHRDQMSEDEFQPLRDKLYLLLMQHAATVDRARQQAKSREINRFGELVKPLLTIAAVVDYSRDKKRQVLDELSKAIERQAERRTQRDQMTPEAMLREAISYAAEKAAPAPYTGPCPDAKPQSLGNGTIILDSLHIAEAFKALFPSARESYFRMEWLAKQVTKTDYIKPWRPEGYSTTRAYRWRREVNERNQDTGEQEVTTKMLSVYAVDTEQLTQN